MERLPGLQSQRFGDTAHPVLEIGSVSDGEPFEEVAPVEVGCPGQGSDASATHVSRGVLVPGRLLDGRLELGEVDTVDFCARLDIEPAERKMVAWLVRQHLLMSQTSQRKDLSDPQNIQEFAEAVGNTRYLDHLYLLTVADIAGTSSKLWNSWKDSLLWELYSMTSIALEEGR